MCSTGLGRCDRAVALVLLLAATGAWGRTIYVDGAALGKNDGTSWTNAHRYLQDALSAAAGGDEIRVAHGTYRPDQTSASPPGPARRSGSSTSSSVGSRTAAFGLKNGVAIKGGYGGWRAPSPDAREAGPYVTVLSGDLAGNDGPDFANRAENCYHVVTGSGVDATALLDRVTITGGNADGSLQDGCGGGLYLENSSLTLAHCTFLGNSARSGGGLYERGTGGATLADCTFRGNSASEAGGGIYVVEASPRIETSTIANNSAHFGGGIACEMSLWIANCVIADNSATYGGAIHCFGCSPRIVNDTIVRNVASGYGGGGIYCGNADPKVVNTIVWNNAPDQIYLKNSSITVAYSAVHMEGRLPWPGVGNLNAAPLFVDPDGADNKTGTEDDNLRLLASSPGVDAGDNAAIASLSPTDRDGNPRILQGRVDIGAYESGVVSGPRVYHVDGVQGDDANSGVSLETAFATIRRGIAAAREGDTVLVYAGVYAGEVDFLGKGITVCGVATKAGVPVLENTRGFAVSFYRGEGPGSVLANFVIRNSFIGVFVAGSSPTIRNTTLVNNDSGVEAYVGAAPGITNCIFWGNTEIDLFQCEARYSRLEQPGEGRHNLRADPLFVDPNNGDYHLRSERGRYWPEHDVWVLDEMTSPCLDAGDPSTPVGQERTPNGGRINMGAYGGTPYASMSEMPSPKVKASNPDPPDGAVGISPNTVLSWTAGLNAVTHDVYIGLTFDQVAESSRNNATVLASMGQRTTTFAPALPLALGASYYWRVDEIDSHGSITEGDVWMFTVASGSRG